MIAVDTNVIGYLLIPGPFTDLAKQAARKDEWCAPVLWRSEFRNVLALYMRQHGMARRKAEELMIVAERLLWGREYSVRSSSVLACVARSNRSAYDCEFVALAADLGLQLVTTDESIVSEFPNIAVTLKDYVQ